MHNPRKITKNVDDGAGACGRSVPHFEWKTITQGRRCRQSHGVALLLICRCLRLELGQRSWAWSTHLQYTERNHRQRLCGIRATRHAKLGSLYRAVWQKTSGYKERNKKNLGVWHETGKMEEKRKTNKKKKGCTDLTTSPMKYGEKIKDNTIAICSRMRNSFSLRLQTRRKKSFERTFMFPNKLLNVNRE